MNNEVPSVTLTLNVNPRDLRRSGLARDSTLARRRRFHSPASRLPQDCNPDSSEKNLCVNGVMC